MILQNRIDFKGIIVAENCNPNGDPISANNPRQDYEGYGEMSDVCLKRKIRNRFQDMGFEILYVSDDKADDGYHSIKQRVDAHKPLHDLLSSKKGDMEDAKKLACEKWIDVRTFGMVIASKAITSLGVRGPVSITMAHSLEPVDIKWMQITKSLNTEGPEGRESSTMGAKRMVAKGVYVFTGSIYPQLAERTEYSEEDAELLKKALSTLFVNDASAARPSGSIDIDRLYWWKHNCRIGQYSPLKVFHSVEVLPSERYPYYTVDENLLEDLECQIVDTKNYCLEA